MQRKIAIIGTGYVGLATGVCLASLGHKVICHDKDENKIQGLKKGLIPIFEPGINELLKRYQSNIEFSTNLKKAVRESEVIILAVGTPAQEDGGIDLSQFKEAVRGVALLLDGFKVIVIKSTVPVGTGNWTKKEIKRYYQGRFVVVSNPEFLREGSAIRDFLEPDRIVLGVEDEESKEVMLDIYSSLEAPKLITDIKSAELIKYAANAFLATKISFINEIANICERTGGDVKKVAEGIGLDKRIGKSFLNAGIGYGGSCFEGEETIFTLNSPDIAVVSLKTLFANSGKSFQNNIVEVVRPKKRQVLAFDLNTGRPVIAGIKAVTKRPFAGTMVQLKTSMGRLLKVTADHPVIRWAKDGFEILPAFAVTPGDRLITLCELPAVNPAADLDLITQLRKTALEIDTEVACTNQSFAGQYAQFAPYIPPEMLLYPHDIKRYNRMPLRVLYHLMDIGVLNVDINQLQLYTAKGAATKINALISIDADLLRFCGYYLAEGFITCDRGRLDAIRERIGLSFHENELEYLVDVRRILTRWGLKFTERHSTHATTLVVSSRIFAWFLRDVLKCGTRSDNKMLPIIAFNVPSALRYELARGAFSGDGAVTMLQHNRNIMMEYATVSRPLADGMTLLLQTLGVIPSIRIRWMNKSKQPAYILRVSGYAQLIILRNIFGEKHRAQIEAVLSGYQRSIKQRGFTRQGPISLLTVRSAEHIRTKTTVYSLETTTGTVVVSSGLICHNCFPKDIAGLIKTADNRRYDFKLLKAVENVNRQQQKTFVSKIKKILKKTKGKTVAVWGLAFKPNTDDMRKAPALEIIKSLQKSGYKIQAYDPAAMVNAKKELPKKNLRLCSSSLEAVKNADVLALVTEWPEFSEIDMQKVKKLMRHPYFMDGRNQFEPEEMKKIGFYYEGIGRK